MIRVAGCWDLISVKLASDSFRYCRVVLAWDLYLALGIGVAVGILMWRWQGVIEPPSGIGVAAITWGTAMLGASWQQFWSVRDILDKDEFGSLVRLADPKRNNVFEPYKIVMIASVVTIALGLFTVLTIKALPHVWEIVLLSSLTTSALYDIFGLISLISTTRWHDGERSRLQAVKETTEADERERKRGQK
jgi:hypothetical protein